MTAPAERRSRLMQMLRVSPGPMLLLCLAGVALMVCNRGSGEWCQLLWDVGYHLLVLAGVWLIVVLWGGVYLQVVEASRGMPGLRVVERPTLSPEAAGQWEALQRSLSGLGFRHAGWFSLDDFDETHVGAWQQEGRVAFVLYYPVGGWFRLRIVRKFPSGGMLVSSTRLNDLAIRPPQGLYVQVRYKATVEELWAWHVEEEKHFPGGPPCETWPRDLYVEVSSRWAGHRRRDQTWLLAVEPFEECWRMYWLCGMPLRRQFDLGWTTPYWK